MRYMLMLLLILSGCHSDDDALPAPAIAMTVTANDGALQWTVNIPQNLSIQDANTANFVYVTALNSGLSVVQDAAKQEAQRAEQVRVSWQTFILGMCTVMMTAIICITMLLKGLIQPK